MTPDLLEEGNKAELIKYLMPRKFKYMGCEYEWRSRNFKWTGLDPGTEYTFAYMAEDWDGVLTDVKIVKATTEAIIAGPNPTMQLNAYMSDLNNFTVQYSIVKDVAKLYYTITEDNYSASGDYTYQECMDVWKSIVWIMVYQVSTQLLNRMIRQVKPNDWLLYVCLLVPMLMEMK